MSGQRVSLPLLHEGHGVRRSHTSPARWRAVSLVLVHLIILAHISHWLARGETVSPVEPSESMETLETGRVNAGFIFFAASIAVTLVFGRFFCGWGCHFIAYQDLCTWLLKRFGIRPVPLRSRLLLFVPLGIALYMFVWPTAYRWWTVWRSPELTQFNPAWTSHLTTTEFWKTFPGWVFALLTFGIAGFSIVYFLGSKGFCTYACPYGAFYGLADQAAVVRVRVSDACDGSSVCTSVCTSNVDVANEVRKYGMVVNPGCMKCGDCISSCPNEALRFGFGRPAFLRKTASADAVRRSDAALPLGEEILLLVAFLFFLFAWRGLYGGFPLLMTAGLSGICSAVVLLAARLLYRPSVALQTLLLKHDGKLAPGGWLSAGLSAVLVAFCAHSSIVQYHRHLGNYHFDRTDVGDSIWRGGPGVERDLSDAIRGARDRALHHFRACARWSLMDTVDLNNKLAWLTLLADDADAAEGHARRSLQLEPDWPSLHYNLGRILAVQGRLDEAIGEFQEALRLDADLHQARVDLGSALLQSGRFDEAFEQLSAYLERYPDDAAAHYYLGALLTERGDVDQAMTHLRRAVAITPALAEAQYQLGYLLLTMRRVDEAVPYLHEAIRLRPSMAVAHYNLGVARFMQADVDGAILQVRKSLQLNPSDEHARAFLAMLTETAGRDHRSDSPATAPAPRD